MASNSTVQDCVHKGQLSLDPIPVDDFFFKENESKDIDSGKDCDIFVSLLENHDPDINLQAMIDDVNLFNRFPQKALLSADLHQFSSFFAFLNNSTAHLRIVQLDDKSITAKFLSDWKINVVTDSSFYEEFKKYKSNYQDTLDISSTLFYACQLYITLKSLDLQAFDCHGQMRWLSLPDFTQYCGSTQITYESCRDCILGLILRHNTKVEDLVRQCQAQAKTD